MTTNAITLPVGVQFEIRLLPAPGSHGEIHAAIEWLMDERAMDGSPLRPRFPTPAQVQEATQSYRQRRRQGFGYCLDVVMGLRIDDL